MSLVVQKFGGSSVATAERIIAAARRAIRAQQAGRQVIVVVSARGDTTDELIALARQITDQPPSREMDVLLSTGEQVSVALMAMAIQSLGHAAVSFTGAQVGIVTDSFHTKARIKNISTERLRRALDAGNIVIVAGFQGVDENYNITTLGRGGSDTTAVALAAVMKHDPRSPATDVDCEIYTDVDGVYTTDPRIIPEACKIPLISYDEMLELASVGAGVMHSRSIEFAKKFDVPLQVRSSFSDVEGTWIVRENAWMRQVPVCGAALDRDEARITLSGVPDEPGVSHRIFSAMADANIVVDMIVQNVGTAGRADVGFTVLHNDLATTLALLGPLAIDLGASLRHEADVSKVSVVGAGMRTHTGVAERMFAALANENINLKMITTSEIKISVLVDRADGTRALRAVHHAFELHRPRRDGADQVEAVRRHLRREPATPVDPHAAPLTNGNAIRSALTAMEDIVVSDVLLDTSQGRISVYGLPNRPGNCSRLFSAIAEAGIVVDMIVQNINDTGCAELSFSVRQRDVDQATAITERLIAEMNPDGRVVPEPMIAEVAVLGVGMRTHTGVARRMFGALAEHGINISMINTSEIRVGVVVAPERAEEALAVLRNTFTVETS